MKLTNLDIAVICLVMFLLLCGLGYGGYNFYRLNAELETTKLGLASTTLAYGQTMIELKQTQDARESLVEVLAHEQQRNTSFAAEIQAITGTVGTLTKLSQTDPQLLQKYSKIYFLNENYVPSSLSYIDPTFLYSKDPPLSIATGVKTHLEAMLKASNDAGIPLETISAYRSFGTQAILKSSYKVTYGSGANTFSADQGYSEHQLGTAVDLTTPVVGATFNGFEKTDAYAWLTAHVYQYGFILSYPPKNTFYQFEPWHWRYVGVALAQKLHDDGVYFYEMDQRTIDSYLVTFFD